MKPITAILAIILFFSSAFSQSNERLINTWEIKDFSIFNKETKTLILGKELQSYPLFEVFSNSIPLTISNNGKLAIFSNQKKNINYKIKENELHIYFAESSNKQSYIAYKFKINNQTLILYREDPLIKELYTFEIK